MITGRTFNEALDRLSTTAIYAIANTLGMMVYVAAALYADSADFSYGCGHDGPGAFYVLALVCVALLLNGGWLVMAILQYHEHKEPRRFAIFALLVVAWGVTWEIMQVSYPLWTRCAA